MFHGYDGATHVGRHLSGTHLQALGLRSHAER